MLRSMVGAVAASIKVRTSPRRWSGRPSQCRPSLPPIVEGLVRAVLPGRIAPPQTSALGEDYATQEASVIYPRLAIALGERRPAAPSARRSAEKATCRQLRKFGSLDHAGRSTSIQSMGPGPGRGTGDQVCFWTSETGRRGLAVKPVTSGYAFGTPGSCLKTTGLRCFRLKVFSTQRMRPCFSREVK